MREEPGPGVGCAFGFLVAMVLVCLILLSPSGGKSGTTTTRTETHVLSDNRIFSPDTYVYINSNNQATTQDTNVTGDRNNVQPVAAPTADPAALQRAINAAAQDVNAAQGGKP